MNKVNYKSADPRKIVLFIIIVGIIAGSIFYILRAKSNTDMNYNNSANSLSGAKPAVKQNPGTTAPTAASPTPTTASKQTISSFDAAGFVNASNSRKLTDFTPWQESPVQQVVKDFTGDSIDDMFVWAKLPGTMGYSIAAVWTLDNSNKPKELWYVPSAEIYAQSSWSVDGNNIIEKGKLNTPGGISDETNVYHWQTNTFVTY